MDDRAVVSAPASQSPAVPLPAPRMRTCCLLAATLGISIFLTGWISRTEDELLPGRLSARTSVIRTPAAGRIEKWLVGSHKTVEQGTQLAVLVDGGLQQRIENKRREIATLDAELKRRRAAAEVELAWRLSNLENEILANRLKAAELLRLEYDHRVDVQAWKNVLRGLPAGIPTSSVDDVFRPAGFTKPEGVAITSRQQAIKGHESARNAAEVAVVQLQLREERLRELRRLIKELPTQVRAAAGIETTAMHLARAKDERKRLETMPTRQTIHADAYGKLLTRVGKPGDVLKSGDVLARIVDDERRYLTVPVPSNRLARFEVGRQVELRFPGNEIRRGKIVEMAAADDARSNRTNIIIEPAGMLWPKVPIGAAVQVVVPNP